MIFPARACTARDNHSRVKKGIRRQNLKALICVGRSGLMVAGRMIWLLPRIKGSDAHLSSTKKTGQEYAALLRHLDHLLQIDIGAAGNCGNDFRENLLSRVGDLATLSPDTLRGLQVLDGASAKTGHLDAKTHELIALAVAITTRCDGCIAVHTKAAARHGASRDEIAEALGVAIPLNAGAAVTYSARVMDACAALENN